MEPPVPPAHHDLTHHTPSTPESPRPAGRGYKDIDSRRGVIEGLYWEEGRELQEVMEIMSSHHQFHASARVYRTAFKRWGLQKNILAEDMRHMARIRKRRRDDGKDTQFSLHRRSVPCGKIDYWIKRTGFEIPPDALRAPPGRRTPPSIQYGTPPPDCSSILATPRAQNTTIAANPVGMQTPVSSPGELSALNVDGSHAGSQTSIGSRWTAVNLPSKPATIPTTPRTNHTPHQQNGCITPTQNSSLHLPPILAPAQGSIEPSHTHTTQPSDARSPMSRLAPSMTEHASSPAQPSTSIVPRPQRGPGRGRTWAQITIGDSDPGPENDNMSHYSYATASPRTIDTVEDRPPESSPALNQIVPDPGAYHLHPAASSESESRRSTELGESLRAAADSGDLARVRELLATTNVNVFHASRDGKTALHSAVDSEDMEMMQVLLAASQNYNHDTDWRKRSEILHAAIDAGKSQCVSLLTLSFMKHTGGIDQQRREETIIHAMKNAMTMNRMECLKRMVQCARQHQGFPWHFPVYFGVTGGYLEALQTFVNHGVDIDIPMEYEDYPLHTAIWQHKKSPTTGKLIEFLKNRVSLHRRDREGREPIHLASFLGHDEALKLLLECQVNPNVKAANGCTAFRYLQMGPKSDKAQNCAVHLAQAGADPNTRNTNGNTLLHYNPRFAAVLVPVGANPNALNLEQETPLIWAALLGDAEGTRQLLAAGADPNIQDARGQTALFKAAERGFPPIVQQLLEGGADPNIQDRIGNTALHQASKLVQGAESRRLLLNGGASPDIENGAGNTPNMIWQQQAETLRQRYNSLVESSLESDEGD